MRLPLAVPANAGIPRLSISREDAKARREEKDWFARRRGGAEMSGFAQSAGLRSLAAGRELAIFPAADAAAASSAPPRLRVNKIFASSRLRVRKFVGITEARV